MASQRFLIEEAEAVRDGLAALAIEFDRHAERMQDRFALASSALVRQEVEKLDVGLRSDDGTMVCRALRSIADMTRGLIDVGSSLRETAPAVWRDAEELASRAHAIERAQRVGR